VVSSYYKNGTNVGTSDATPESHATKDGNR
jgi:hypothetical protein